MTIRSIAKHGLAAGAVLAVMMTVGWLLKVLVRALAILVGRYVLGRPIFGQTSTNATFFSDGTERYRRPAWWGRREPTRWAYLAGWKRAVWRLAVPAAAAGVAWTWARWPTMTRWSLALVLGGALGLLVWEAWQRYRIRHHMDDYVRPLRAALLPLLGRYDEELESRPPLEWLQVPVNFRDRRAVIRVWLPRTFTTGSTDDVAGRGALGNRARVNSVVYEKLGLSSGEMTAAFHMVGADPVVEYTHAPKSPDVVWSDDVADAMSAAADSAPVIGLGRGGKPVSVDLDAESPHVLLSMGSGAGKSMLLRGQIAQHLARGARVVILDPKRNSQRWCRDHPHVRYLRDAADMHDELVACDGEVDRRARLIDDAEGAADAVDVGPRLVVVIEEANALATELTRHWSRVRERKDPSRSPALDSLARVLLMGRELLANVYMSAQYGTARAVGGAEGRENFATRILGRYTQNAWRMLVPEVWPMPRKSTRAGRVQVVLGGTAHETQVTRWTDEAARAWAWSCFAEGQDVSASQLPREAFYRGEQGVTVSDVTTSERQNVITSTRESTSRGHLELVREAASEPSSAVATLDRPESVDQAGDELVTLREAADRRLVLASASTSDKALHRLRAARRRDPEFPDPVDTRESDKAQRYRVADLQRWERNRPRGESA